MQTGVMILGCEGYDGLSAGAAFKPIQIQDLTAGVPQPSANFSYLKRPIFRTEVAIRQLGDFLSGARFLDLIQGSLHPFIETGIRVRRLSHLLLSRRKAKLIKPAQVVICLAAHSLIKDEGLKGNFLGPTGQSICGLPPVHALRQRRLKGTSVQIHWDPRFAFPNSHWPAIQQWSLASPLVCRSTHVRCWPRFPSTAEQLRGSAVLRLLPSQSNFIETARAHSLVLLCKL
jgi:hypothetical protein